MSKKTVIVVGLPRGGTSMITGALETLGIYMGDTHPPLCEDQVLGTLLEKGDHRTGATVIQNCNREYDVWGIKNPTRRLLQRR